MNKKNNNKKNTNKGANNVNHFKLPLLIVGITLIVGIAVGVGIIFLSSPTKLSNTNYEANAGKGNATIKSLTANGSTNNVKKSGNTYNVNVANNVSKVTIKITTTNNKATISEPSGLKDKVQDYDLKAGEPKEKKIRVYSANKKNHQDYYLVMTRAKATQSSKPKTTSSSKPKATSSVGKGNAKISALTVKDAITGASATVKFNSDNDTYSTTVANSISKVRVNIETKNPKAKIIEPAGLKGDKVVTWELVAGKTKEVKIKVRSENGNKTNEYKLKITREAKPKTKSSDATLKSVKIYKTEGYNSTTKTGTEVNASWDKNFNKNTISYNIKLPSKVNSIKLVAYPNDNGAIISYPYTMRNNQAEYAFKAKETRTPTITVTAENGTTKTYTFNITSTSSTSATRNTRVKSSDATLKSLKVGNKNVSIVKDKYDYDVSVESGKKTLEVKLNNQYAMILTPSGLRDLNETYTIEANATKTIKIKVQAENGTTKTYNINIKGTKATSSSKPKATSSSKLKVTSSVGKGNAKISALTVKDANTGASATVKYNSDNDTYSTTVANSISKVRVNIETKNPKAKIIEPAGLKGDKVVTWELVAGKTKEVKIKVRSENGNKTNEYKLKITREAKPKTKSSDATLKTVKLYKTDGYDKTTKTGKEINASWDKNFSKNNTTYNIILPSGIREFEMVAYPNDNGAVISSPPGMINNQAIYTITNKKTIQIVVKAENGATKTYTFNMTLRGQAASSSNDKIESKEENPAGTGEQDNPKEENIPKDDKEEIEEEIKTVKKIVVNNEEIKLNKGRSAEMVAIVLPGTVTNREVTWESADENIATVDENGIIYGVNAGTTTIIATSISNPDIQKTINVTINQSIYDNNKLSIIEKSKLYDINKDNIVNLVDYSIVYGIYLNNPQYINNHNYPEWKKQLDLINPNGIDLNDVSSICHYILFKI